MQIQTLEQLVQDTVDTFIALGQSFSVYDITTNIRNLANSGAVEPIGTRVYGQAFDFQIEHSDVKSIFNELYEDNGFSEPLSCSFTGSYYLYSALGAVNPVAATVRAKVSPLQSLTQAVQKFGQAAKSATAATAALSAVAPKGALDEATVISRVRQYLDGCEQRGVTPTSRQIQSAIKRNGKSTGWSRSELDSIRNDINAGLI
jgi:hypothetical protein